VKAPGIGDMEVILLFELVVADTPRRGWSVVAEANAAALLVGAEMDIDGEIDEEIEEEVEGGEAVAKEVEEDGMVVLGRSTSVLPTAEDTASMLGVAGTGGTELPAFGIEVDIGVTDDIGRSTLDDRVVRAGDVTLGVEGGLVALEIGAAALDPVSLGSYGDNRKNTMYPFPPHICVVSPAQGDAQELSLVMAKPVIELEQ